MNKAMGDLRWFYPGIRVKRWIALIIAGVLIFLMGSVFIMGRNIPREFYYYVTARVRQGVFGFSCVLLGIVFVWYGVRRLTRRFVSLFLPSTPDERVVDLLFEDMYLSRGLKIVGIGGGTGLHTLLRGLKKYSSNITAIVTVSDDGGSSGRLRDEFNMLPPGDIRQCIAALADSETMMVELFQSRFRGEGQLKDHSVGNLLLAAMSELTGDFYTAIKELSKVLAIRGAVLPSTLESVTLCGELDNGLIVRGETNITNSASTIRRVFLSPSDCEAVPEAIEAIRDADAVIIGPGSLYTSIVPNLLVKDLLNAVRTTGAIKIYVCNVMSQPGETDNFTAADHASKIVKLLGKKSIDYIMLNGKYPSRQLKRYEEKGQKPVTVDTENLQKLGIRHIIVKDLIQEDEMVRHDPVKLAEEIIKIIKEERPLHPATVVPFELEKLRTKLSSITTQKS